MADAIRKSCLNRINIIYSTVKKHATTPISYLDAEDYKEECRQIMEKCRQAHYTALETCVDGAAINVQDTAQMPVEAAAHTLRVQLQEIILALQPSTASSSGGGTSTPSVYLPKLEITVFDGSFAMWPSFKDLFYATIDKHPSLSPAQKLHYLRLHLSEKPLSLINRFLITDANYKEAWRLLESRYSNKREIVYEWIDKLFHQPKSLQEESPTGLQGLMDNTNECLSSLEVLGMDIQSWDSIIVTSILRKVDPNTRCEWAVRQTGSDLPTLTDFFTFLTNHIRGLIAKGTAVRANNAQPKRNDKQVKAHAVTSDRKCPCCTGPHPIWRCETFLAKSPKDRSTVIQQNHLCFNCISGKHPRKECPSQSRCRRCGKEHHTLLHEDKHPPPPPSSHRDQPQPPPFQNRSSTGHVSIQSNVSLSEENCQVLLFTAVVLIEDKLGYHQQCRAFIDPGSQASFISEDCYRRLELKKTYSSLSVTGIAATHAGTALGKVEVELQSQQNNAQLDPMVFHILRRVTGELPESACPKLEWPHLQGLSLADPEYFNPQRIDILIGADYYGEVIEDGIRKGPNRNSPFAQNTVFGWILCGRCPLIEPPRFQVCHVTTDFDIIRRFWEVEEPPRTRILTQEEKECEEHFKQTYQRDATGRFIVSIPFNSKRAALGASKSTAVRRFLQVEKRLQQQPHLRKQYSDFMQEYEALGHMEQIPATEVAEKVGSTFYLPHHFVVNESSSTTKLRVVFDGSVKSSTGVSLNDSMLVGATLQDELYILLLRFRLHPIVLKADIAKMFRQFRLAKDDADMHRIVWRETPDQPIREYRLTTITYGTACAPNLSTRCLQQLAMDVKVRYNEASNSLHNESYVDDVMTGTTTVKSAIALYHQLTASTATAGLDLRKWSSNSNEVLAVIPSPHQEIDPQSFDNDSTVKALGLRWDPLADNFRFNYIPFTVANPLTKRILLSDLARVFDPLGLIACVTIRAKILLQELWKSTAGWDDPVPEYIRQQWLSYQEDMKQIEAILIPRWSGLLPEEDSHHELHGFCDASEAAYGAVIYLREMTKDGTYTSTLYTSKTRVSPLRQVTLPRLELMGALLLAELISEVQTALQLKGRVYLWTDSTITLRWISSQPRRWKTFVANRVAKIQTCTPVECWRHVPGKENPADLASRGVTPTELSSSFWLSGPEWLQHPELPLFAVPSISTETELEEKGVPVLTCTVPQDLSILEKYSSLSKLQRVTSYLFRFMDNEIIKLQPKRSGPLTAVELQNSLMVWIRKTQQIHFATEIATIKKTEQVQPSSKLKSLHPFIDNHGTLRISGRLAHSPLSDSRKHQIILPANCHLTNLIVEYFHLLTLHGGFQLTWSAILAQYWIIGGRNKARFFVRSCVKCRRFRAEAAEQLMGSLPAARITPSRPFTNTGVDFAGPFTLKNPVGRAPKTYKGYLCVFVCMATKAIHLEPVSALTTEEFIATFRRFSCRRGFPFHMYSDQGSNFIGADKELRNMIHSWKSSNDLPDNLSGLNITWHWNPPNCAHAGGLWEAGVKSAKHHLRRVVGDSVLTYEQFATILCQIEAILNSRPLYPFSSDPTDFAVLTPGHFLIGDPLIAVPEGDLSGVPSNRLSIYQQQQHRVQEFWRRWSRDYLNTLQQRNKWWWKKPNLKEGDLVLMVENSPPSTWKLARVIKVHPGSDDQVRVVTIRSSTNSTFQRSTDKLIPLFCNDK